MSPERRAPFALEPLPLWTALGALLCACAPLRSGGEERWFARGLVAEASEERRSEPSDPVAVPSRESSAVAPGAQVQQAGAQGSPAASTAAQSELERALAEQGLSLDLAAGVLSLPASVLVRNDLLEYLLVARNGALHESLFVTSVRPSLLNAALLLLHVEPGVNARWIELAQKDERGRAERQVFPPSGDGFYLYVAWREAGETFFFRVEDVVRNLESGRSLRRHRWVFLGSRFAALRPGEPESFLADVEGNVINLSYFFQGNTLLTAVPEECLGQTIWAANEWLLPPRGAPVRLFFARAPLERLEPAWIAGLPEVEPAASQQEEGEEEGR